ncbi:hypothetical protein I79_013163 [Cricetulus griseus]|uniref:Uncharacterized protein n=1 Tax=Cricetulus griseus TaxID=10029 RepID=G3HQQ8_CRIGR|nr:hypothetical protein I79_013163 [Cricetulus griseus]
MLKRSSKPTKSLSPTPLTYLAWALQDQGGNAACPWGPRGLLVGSHWLQDQDLEVHVAL